jgi:DNA replication protein DnaC
MSGLDARGRRMTFDSMVLDKWNSGPMEDCRKYVERLVAGEGGRGIYLYGSYGTGKTHLACAVANAVLDAGLWVRVVRVAAMPRNDQDVVDELADDGWPLVVLDDMGAAKSTARLVECMFTIVDGRLWYGAPLVITSNYNLEKLEKRLDDGGDSGGRIVSRIREACDLIPLGGPDRRKRELKHE